MSIANETPKLATNATARLLNELGEPYFYINHCNTLCWSHLSKQPSKRQAKLALKFDNCDWGITLALV